MADKRSRCSVLFRYLQLAIICLVGVRSESDKAFYDSSAKAYKAIVYVTPDANLNVATNLTQDILGVYALNTVINYLNGSSLYNVGPFDGCDAFDVSTYPANATAKWAAVVSRGGCEYVVKAQNALNAGASSLLIGNYQQAVLISVPDVPITVMSISRTSYNRLNALPSGAVILNNIIIDEGEFVQLGSSNNYTVFMGIASIVALVVLVGVITAVHVHNTRRQRRGRLHSIDDAKIQLALRKEGLEELESFIYRKPTEEDDPEDPRISFCASCAVCIDDFAEGDKLRRLPCSHVFHQDCIDPWLLQKTSCPYCKMDYLTKKYPVFPNSQSNLAYLSSNGVGHNSRHVSSRSISHGSSTGSSGTETRGTAHHNTHTNMLTHTEAYLAESIPDLETYANTNNTHPVVDSTEDEAASIPNLSTFDDSDNVHTSGSGIDSLEDADHTETGLWLNDPVTRAQESSAAVSPPPLHSSLPIFGEKSAAKSEESCADRVKSMSLKAHSECECGASSGSKDDREAKKDTEERFGGPHSSLAVGSDISDDDDEGVGQVYMV